MKFPALFTLFLASSVASILLEKRRAPEHWEYLVRAVSEARSRPALVSSCGFFFMLLFMAFTGPFCLALELGVLVWSAYYDVRHRIALWRWEREFPLCPMCKTHHKANAEWACWMEPCRACGLIHTGDVPCPGAPS